MAMNFLSIFGFIVNIVYFPLWKKIWIGNCYLSISKRPIFNTSAEFELFYSSFIVIRDKKFSIIHDLKESTEMIEWGSFFDEKKMRFVLWPTHNSNTMWLLDFDVCWCSTSSKKSISSVGSLNSKKNELEIYQNRPYLGKNKNSIGIPTLFIVSFSLPASIFLVQGDHENVLLGHSENHGAQCRKIPKIRSFINKIVYGWKIRFSTSIESILVKNENFPPCAAKAHVCAPVRMSSWAASARSAAGGFKTSFLSCKLRSA